MSGGRECRVEMRALFADGPGFLSVAEHGSFAAAGRRLGLSPSVLSRQVARLERALGVRLLERNTRGLRLTDDGSSVRRRLEDLFALAEDLAGSVESSATTASGTVRLGAPRDLADRLLHPLMPRLLDALPEVSLQLLVTDRPLDPVADGLDLVLSVTGSPVEGLVARRLRRVRHRLCAAPGYLRRRGAPGSPDELAAHECIRPAEGTRDSLWHLASGVAEARVAVAGRYSVDHAGLRLSAAADGRGIACVPDFVAAAALAAGRVVPVLPDWHVVALPEEHVQLQYPATRLLPNRTRAVIERLASALGEPSSPAVGLRGPHGPTTSRTDGRKTPRRAVRSSGLVESAS